MPFPPHRGLREAMIKLLALAVLAIAAALLAWALS